MEGLKTKILALGFMTLGAFSSVGNTSKENTFIKNSNTKSKNSMRIVAGEKLWLNSKTQKTYSLTPFIGMQYERRIIDYLSFEAGMTSLSKIKKEDPPKNTNEMFGQNTFKAFEGNLGVKGYLSLAPNEGFTPYIRIGLEKTNGFKQTAQKSLSNKNLSNIKTDAINSSNWYIGGGLEFNKGILGIGAGINAHKSENEQLSNIDAYAGIKLRF